MNATPTTSTRRIAQVFFHEAKKYKLQLAVVLVCLVGASLISAIAPLFYKRFFDILAGGLQEEASVHAAFAALSWALILHGVQWFLWRPAGFVHMWLATKIATDLSNMAFSGLLKHSYDFFTNSFVGGLTRRVSRFSHAFRNIFDEIIFTLLPLAVSTVAMLVVVFFRSATIGWILLAWAAFFLYVNYLAVRWKQKYEVERAEADSVVSGTLSDVVVNSSTIKLFSSLRYEEGNFGAAVERMRKIWLLVLNLNEIIRGVQGLLTVLVEVVVMIGAFRLYQQGLLTIGDFVLFQSYIIALVGSLWGFGNVLKHIYQASADAKEMVDIIDMPQGVSDVPGAKALSVSQGKIEFKGVDFNFNETRKVLEDFSLTIEPHEKVALIGLSGAGKTTVTKLLFRFYDVTSGAIMIDGQDIAKVTQESLRDAIALVPQEPILFHRSLMDNIRYGRRDASDAEVLEAAKKAHCHEFIASLPEGYDTMVGERGVKLSGGERQRVAIARAILKNAPILVLDEATSSLDSESEHLIQDALATLMRGKTVIVIAHRLSTIISMDRIIVLEHGDVRATGTHKELVEQDELYKKLWSIQAGGFLQDEEVEE